MPPTPETTPPTTPPAAPDQQGEQRIDFLTLEQKLSSALEKKESKEKLRQLGDLLYEQFKSPEYTADDVLPSIADVYKAHKQKLDPPLSFINFIKSFGPGMVSLCQQKLVQEGGYDLGKYGAGQDGVDGKLGKMTNKALRGYFQKLHPAKPDAPDKTSDQSSKHPVMQIAVEPNATTRPAFTPSAPSDSPTPPEKASPERLTLSRQASLRQPVLDIYRRTDNNRRTVDLPRVFGRNREKIERYITNVDPITGGPLTFLGRPIAPSKKGGKSGLNILMIPLLKVAEEKINALGYRPRAKAIGGYEFRGMKVGGKETATMSSHAFGWAIDIDSGTNRPEDGRGDIPDQVVMAMVESGFATGLVRDADYSPELGKDAMHFQARFDAASSDGQAIIQNSENGRKYWEAIQPMLSKIDNPVLTA